MTTPQEIALIDARKGALMFQKVGIPVLGLVNNMSSYACPECGHHSHIFGATGAQKLSKEIGYNRLTLSTRRNYTNFIQFESHFICPFVGVNILADIPLDTSIMEAADQGHPIVISSPKSNPLVRLC